MYTSFMPYDRHGGSFCVRYLRDGGLFSSLSINISRIAESTVALFLAYCLP